MTTTLPGSREAAQALDEIEAALEPFAQEATEWAEMGETRQVGNAFIVFDLRKAAHALSLLPTLRAALAPPADGAGEVEEIRTRHDLADNGDMEGEDWDTYVAFEDAHTDRATLLRLLSEERARRVEVEGKCKALSYVHEGAVTQAREYLQEQLGVTIYPIDMSNAIGAYLEVVTRATNKDTQDE